jgi:hypothetical protein
LPAPEAAGSRPTLVTPELLSRIVGLPVPASLTPAVFAGMPALEASIASDDRTAEIMSGIEQVIAQRRFRVVGAGDDQAVWQKGWSEVAEALGGAGGASLDALKPQYFHRGVEMRMLGAYFAPQTDYFEYLLGIAVRRLLMLHAFDRPRRIVELGCGTGMNLIIAAELFAEAELAGSDWAPASVQILSSLSTSLARPVAGTLYNMLTGEGAEALPIDADTDVLTVHALEQLGSAGPGVIDMLVRRRPRRVLHIEPILDFYDRTLPYDDIAARYHQERGYLEGLWPTLRERAAKGEVEVLSKGRVKLGNLYHEAYSFILWRPA